MCSAKEDVGIKENFNRMIEVTVTEIMGRPEKMAKMRFLGQNQPPPPPPVSSSFCRV
jgi:hypothetical protein